MVSLSLGAMASCKETSTRAEEEAREGETEPASQGDPDGIPKAGRDGDRRVRDGIEPVLGNAEDDNVKDKGEEGSGGCEGGETGGIAGARVFANVGDESKECGEESEAGSDWM